MSSYRYLGYGITNENGVAQLKYDENGDELEHSYTGVGAGEVDVVASLDNPVSSGSIVSETLSVLDTLMYDTGTDATHNIWAGDTSNLSRGNEYSTLREAEEGTTTRIVTQLPKGLWFLNMQVRRDGSAGNYNFEVIHNNATIFGWATPNGEVWADLKIVYDGEYISCFINDSSTPARTERVYIDETKNTYFRLQTPQAITYVDFKDLYVFREGASSISIGSSTPVIQSGDTATINGSLYESGLPVQNATLDVYKNGTKVGTASTGDSGVASYTYTGVADGEVEFQFKYGSIVSQPYTVLDSLFYDDGTQTPTSSRYSISSGDTNVSVETDGIKVERTSASSSSWVDVKINNGTSWRDNNTDYCIEAEISFGSDGGMAYIGIGDGAVSMWELTGGNSGSGSVKLVTDGDTVKCYWNDGYLSTKDKTMTTSKGAYFQCYQKCWITFKNLKIYPI